MRSLFIILAQSSKTVEPSKGIFRNSPLRRNLKAFLPLAVGDLRSHPKDLFTSIPYRPTVIATVKPKQGQPGEERQSPQKPTSSHLILFIQHTRQTILMCLPRFGVYNLCVVCEHQTQPSLFSAVWTYWRWIITTLGSASRSSCK